MKIILKSLSLLILGILIGSFINMGFIIIGDLIFIKPEDFNPLNAMNWDIKYFIFPFIAHAFGTFSGSYSASKLSNNDNKTIPLLIGFFFLSGGIYMALIVPAPNWFLFLDLIAAYIPMAILGWSIGKK